MYYQQAPHAVVVLRDGREVARYPAVENLVEMHIKGLLAINEEAARDTMVLLRKYRTPSGLPR